MRLVEIVTAFSINPPHSAAAVVKARAQLVVRVVARSNLPSVVAQSLKARFLPMAQTPRTADPVAAAAGSVWITAQTVTGAGTITAHGGNGEPIHGGGGGGGRIAIHSNTNNFTGTLAAYGGLGWKIGGAGTIYTKPTTDAGLLLVDNGGNAGTNSLVSVTNQADVVIRGRAGVIPTGACIARDVMVASNSALVFALNTLNTFFLPPQSQSRPAKLSSNQPHPSKRTEGDRYQAASLLAPLGSMLAADLGDLAATLCLMGLAGILLALMPQSS